MAGFFVSASKRRHKNYKIFTFFIDLTNILFHFLK